MFKRKERPLFVKKKRPGLFARLPRLIAMLGVLAIIGGGFGVFWLRSWSETQIALQEPVIVDFPRGTTATSLAGILERRGLVDKALNFALWVKYFSNYSKFQAGLYRFEKSVSPSQIAARIMSGKIYEPIILQFTIPEGFTLKQIQARLIALGVGTKADYKRIRQDRTLLRKNKIPSKTLEGYLYPATYSFIRKQRPLTVVTHMINTFWEKLPKNYEESVLAKGLSLNEAVTFASLIELETKHEDEKSMVSEVIWRRLKRREPLAIDAALIYGIKDYDGDIKWKHLKDKKIFITLEFTLAYHQPLFALRRSARS